MIENPMPPIKNWPLYIWRVIGKWLSFLVFGIGTSALATSIFPIMGLFLHPKARFQKYARRIITASFHWFTDFMTFLHVVVVDVDDRKAYRNLRSKIVVANHPSLLDVVMMISLIPNADCIVRGNLNHNIVYGVIRYLYILNSLGFDELVKTCKESLDRGNCIIIFPQGTRTPRSGEIKLKKGAARLSLLTGSSIVPVHIGGTDKWGLGKHDPWYAFNHTQRYVYRIRMQDEIDPAKYAGLDYTRAVTRYTAEIRGVLSNPPKP
jgi:1-acyl-sn-glycerol-3-phosphate acyltransferase